MGDGILELLQLVDQHGSIRSAAKVMGLSYVKALLILNRLERKLGGPVVDRRAGGALGGGARLTPFGARFIKAYEKYSLEVRHFADQELKKMIKAQSARSATEPRSKRKRK